jgi:hypothetical protein
MLISRLQGLDENPPGRRARHATAAPGWVASNCRTNIEVM